MLCVRWQSLECQMESRLSEATAAFQKANHRADQAEAKAQLICTLERELAADTVAQAEQARKEAEKLLSTAQHANQRKMKYLADSEAAAEKRAAEAEEKSLQTLQFAADKVRFTEANLTQKVDAVKHAAERDVARFVAAEQSQFEMKISKLQLRENAAAQKAAHVSERRLEALKQLKHDQEKHLQKTISVQQRQNEELVEQHELVLKEQEANAKQELAASADSKKRELIAMATQNEKLAASAAARESSLLNRAASMKEKQSKFAALVAAEHLYLKQQAESKQQIVIDLKIKIFKKDQKLEAALEQLELKSKALANKDQAHWEHVVALTTGWQAERGGLFEIIQRLTIRKGQLVEQLAKEIARRDSLQKQMNANLAERALVEVVEVDKIVEVPVGSFADRLGRRVNNSKPGAYCQTKIGELYEPLVSVNGRARFNPYAGLRAGYLVAEQL